MEDKPIKKYKLTAGPKFPKWVDERSKDFHLTRISMPPYFSFIHSINAEIDSPSTTSSWWTSTLKPPSCKTLAASMPTLVSLDANITVNPCPASCLAISKPIPLLAPVTTAIVFSDHHLKGNLKVNLCTIVWIMNKMQTEYDMFFSLCLLNT